MSVGPEKRPAYRRAILGRLEVLCLVSFFRFHYFLLYPLPSAFVAVLVVYSALSFVFAVFLHMLCYIYAYVFCDGY